MAQVGVISLGQSYPLKLGVDLSPHSKMVLESILCVVLSCQDYPCSKPTRPRSEGGGQKSALIAVHS
jgi:hypothetical protein